jgi:hypothetical protein
MTLHDNCATLPFTAVTFCGDFWGQFNQSVSVAIYKNRKK